MMQLNFEIVCFSLGPCVIPWAFHDHFGFFAELYSLNGADSKKSCRQFFRSHLRPQIMQIRYDVIAHIQYTEK